MLISAFVSFTSHTLYYIKQKSIRTILGISQLFRPHKHWDISTFFVLNKGDIFYYIHSIPIVFANKLQGHFFTTHLQYTKQKISSSLRSTSNRSCVYCCNEQLNNSVCEGAFFYVVGNTSVITEILHLMSTAIIKSFVLLIFRHDLIIMESAEYNFVGE